MDFEIGIVEHKDFSHEAIRLLEGLGKVFFFDEEKESISEFINTKTCIFVRLKYFFNKDIISPDTKLKYICSPTTGLNHFDLDYIAGKGIQVISLKGETEFLNTIAATPEHTLGLALSLLRNYKGAFLSTDNTGWNRELYKGYELKDINAGIIGMGRVGNILCRYLSAFDAKVRYYDTDGGAANRYNAQKSESIEELIENSEIVFLCASYSRENEAFMSMKYIDLLKDKFFVNTSRGELIDEEHLMKRLEDDYFKGVALDVIANETKDNNLCRLVKLTDGRNLIITPHIAGATYQSMWNTEIFTANKLKRILQSM